MKATCTSRVTDVRELGMRVVNERGELEMVAALTHNNRKPTVRLTLRSGRRVTATHNHPLRVVSERGFVVWRKAGEIRTGDTVGRRCSSEEAACGGALSEDEAVFLGYLVAEGTLGTHNRQAVRFMNWDPEVAADGRPWRRVSSAQQFVTTTARNMSSSTPCCASGSPMTKAWTTPTRLLDRAATVFTSGAKAQRAFLSALFEGDGWIDPSSTVGLGTASRVLGEQVQPMLYGLGIPATLQTTRNAVYDRDYYSVVVQPRWRTASSTWWASVRTLAGSGAGTPPTVRP